MKRSYREVQKGASLPSPRDGGPDGALMFMGVTAIIVIAGLGLDVRPILQVIVEAGRDLIHQAGMILSQV